jgi:hypothetical protein
MLIHRWCVCLFRLGMGLGAVLATTACGGMPPLASSVTAADPATRVPAAHYCSVTPTGLAPMPAEPQPWQDRDQNAAPLPAQPQGR